MLAWLHKRYGQLPHYDQLTTPEKIKLFNSITSNALFGEMTAAGYRLTKNEIELVESALSEMAAEKMKISEMGIEGPYRRALYEAQKLLASSEDEIDLFDDDTPTNPEFNLK